MNNDDLDVSLQDGEAAIEQKIPFGQLEEQARAIGWLEDVRPTREFAPVKLEDLPEVQLEPRRMLATVWGTLVSQPIAAVSAFLGLVVATALLPFLGSVYRMESAYAGLSRLGQADADLLGRIAVPDKTRSAYRRGLFRMFGSVLRTDLTVTALILLTAIFLAVPAALLYPMSFSLQLALYGVAPSVAELAMLPVAIAGALALGWLGLLFGVTLRLSSRLRESQLNSTVHVRLFGLARIALRRSRKAAFTYAALPTILGLALGVVAGLWVWSTGELLPRSQLFMQAAVLIPVALAFFTYIFMVQAKVADELARSIAVEHVERTTDGSISLAARFFAVLSEIWTALLGKRQTRYLTVGTAIAAIAVLASVLGTAAEELTYAQVGVLAVLVASFTVLGAASLRRGSVS